MQQKETVLVYAKRTPIGKFCGSLSEVSAPKLGAALVQDAIRSIGVDGRLVDEILMGQVLTAGVGQAPARQAAIFGGLPASVCATTVNRVCGSGLKTVMMADQAIRLGDADLIFAGGQENMSMAPHLLPGSRKGHKFGNKELVDHMQWDGLWDPYDNVAMGACGEICAKENRFSREAQDEYAKQSYERAQAASSRGSFDEEIISIPTRVRRKEVLVERDEEPFSVDFEKMVKLRPAFESEGTITAANASSINDGAAMVVACSREFCERQGLQPLAKIVAHASYAHEPKFFTTAPVDSMRATLEKAKLSVRDIDLFEINEAFSVVPMYAMSQMNLSSEQVNVNGGAVAMGHPIGASGARILVTLLHALRERGRKLGMASICIGGGEASSMIVEMM